MTRAEVISIKYLGRLTTERDRADLERDIVAAIEGAAASPPAGRCSCSCADKCPLGKMGSQAACTADELRNAMLGRLRAYP